MYQKGAVLLISLILLFTPAAFFQEDKTPAETEKANDEMNEAVKLQREIGTADKKLELTEKEAKIAELKKKMAQDLKEAAAIQNQGIAVGSGVQQVSLGDTTEKSQVEIKMIMISAESKKALLKTDSGYLLIKVGDNLQDNWQVAEIDKESVLFKKGEELKRYRIGIR